MMQRVHVRGLWMEVGLFASAVLEVVLLGRTTAAVFGSRTGSALKAVGAAIACSRSVAACAVKAAAMAMAPLIPVPATRQMTVL